jgi:hypothetical protein
MHLAFHILFIELINGAELRGTSPFLLLFLAEVLASKFVVCLLVLFVRLQFKG